MKGYNPVLVVPMNITKATDSIIYMLEVHKVYRRQAIQLQYSIVNCLIIFNTIWRHE